MSNRWQIVRRGVILAFAVAAVAVLLPRALDRVARTTPLVTGLADLPVVGRFLAEACPTASLTLTGFVPADDPALSEPPPLGDVVGENLVGHLPVLAVLQPRESGGGLVLRRPADPIVSAGAPARFDARVPAAGRILIELARAPVAADEGALWKPVGLLPVLDEDGRAVTVFVVVLAADGTRRPLPNIDVAPGILL